MQAFSLLSNLKNLLAVFSRFFSIIFEFFWFFAHDGPRDLLQDLIISCCIVCRVKGMVFDFFNDSSFSSFVKFIFFSGKLCSKIMEPVKLFKT